MNAQLLETPANPQLAESLNLRRDRPSTGSISSISRRCVIAAASALSFVGLPSVAVSAKRPRSEKSARLSRLIVLHDRARNECERFDKEIEMPAHQECVAAIAALPIELPPAHVESATTFVNAFGDTVRLSTKNVGTAAVARKLINDPSWSDMGDDDWRRAHIEIATAADRRDAFIAEQSARRQALERETRTCFRIDAIASRSNELDDRRYKIWRAVIMAPAAGMPDLVRKLDFIKRTTLDDEIDHQVFAAISADIRTLGGAA